jgi:squalene synthase HpnC
VEAIYRFAREADDLADEGEFTPAQRLESLAALRRDLDRALGGAVVADPILDALAREARQWRLPAQCFHDLLDAFTQDVRVDRYPDYATLLDYCRRSANPVGRLLLHLYGVNDAAALRQSDAICSALQLVNFWQDVGIDWNKGRVYLPLDDCQRFDIDAMDLPRAQGSTRWRELMRFEGERTRALMLSGAPLARQLGGRIGLELRLVVEGGLRILERIDRIGGDVFHRRPTLGGSDWCVMLTRALRLAWRTK